MSIPKTFDHEAHEDAIYAAWEQSGLFQPSKNATKKPFTVMMPPPNATGSLHLGHATMLAIEDIMIRFKRMQGHKALWVPGTDHASIATQNRVEKNLAEKGITRHSLGRDAFLKEVESFAENSKSTIRNQIKKMGASCDWSRERYTLDEGLSKAVSEVFIRMYNDGLIYRGNRIVNWCTRCGSTLANDEVEYKQVKDKFYYIKYGQFIIGTARPETKFHDKYLVVNPNDHRFTEFVGKKITVDWINGPIEATVIADPVVDPEFGTGAMTITPAHSFEDFELAQKLGLDIEQIINEKGEMTALAGKYEGMNVKECRAKLVEEMHEMGLIHEIDENYIHNLSVCYRCDTPIEPLISKQWFIDVDKKVVNWNDKKKSLKEIALEVVRQKEIEIIPSEFEKVYFNWMENLHDWCISRQIWFGHRIPVWYKNEEQKVQAKSPGQGWEQDSDTLDTWFSSGLWTFSTLGWPEQTEDFKTFHPTSVLETGHDILFFWIARMILMTTYATGQIPFEKVYLHGLVRDKQGRKMSKSLGNGIDPLDMIVKYGTDAVRLSLVIGSTPGRDIKLYEEKIAGFRNFVTKVWNSSRFALLNINTEHLPFAELKPEDVETIYDKWILHRLQETIAETTTLLEEFKYSEAGYKIYNFLWDEFCDWYLEFSKKQKNEKVLHYVLKNILVMLHPFTPFVTEEIWSNLKEKELLISKKWPTSNNAFKFEDAADGELLIKVIKEIRTLKSHFGLSSNKDLNVTIIDRKKRKLIQSNLELITQMAKISELKLSDQDINIPQAALCIINKDIKIYLHLEGKINFEEETLKAKKELSEKNNHKKSLESKLNNPGFKNNAPTEVVTEIEKSLENSIAAIADLEARINVLENHG